MLAQPPRRHHRTRPRTRPLSSAPTLAVLIIALALVPPATVSCLSTSMPMSMSMPTSTSTSPPKLTGNSRGVAPMTTKDGNVDDAAARGVFCRAEIDYSAANEYVAAHYRGFDDADDGAAGYFPSDRAVEPIHDARLGFRHGVAEGSSLVTPSLEVCGFSLRDAPSDVTDWRDLDQIRRSYLPQLRRDVIPRAFGIRGDRISHVIFWHPMYRGEDQVIEGTIREDPNRLPTAPVASMAHIDTDVGACRDAEEVVNLVANNRFDDEEQSKHFDPSEVAALIGDGGRRFAIVNAWRSARTDVDVVSSPLAVLSPSYEDSSRLPSNMRCFPNVRPLGDDGRVGGSDGGSGTSRWYAYPQMKPDECLLFLQYDRDVRVPSDLWHCALPVPSSSVGDRGSDPNAPPPPPPTPPRRSFDVRALVVFDEEVSVEHDRFHEGRTRPVLNREESGCFCDEQAAKRNSGGGSRS